MRGDLDEAGYKSGPAGLMTCANSGAIVAVKVFVEQNQIPPVRILLELLAATIDGSLPILAGENADQAVGAGFWFNPLALRHPPGLFSSGRAPEDLVQQGSQPQARDFDSPRCRAGERRAERPDFLEWDFDDSSSAPEHLLADYFR